MLEQKIEALTAAVVELTASMAGNTTTDEAKPKAGKTKPRGKTGKRKDTPTGKKVEVTVVQLQEALAKLAKVDRDEAIALMGGYIEEGKPVKMGSVNPDDYKALFDEVTAALEEANG